MTYYNDGTGTSIDNDLSTNITQLFTNDSNFTLDIAQLNLGISNLNPTNVDGQILSLQNKDISIDSDISILFTGYSNNSNGIANIVANGASGTNYDAQILALQNKDISLTDNINSLQVKDTSLDSNISSVATSLNTGYSNNSNLILALTTKENIDINFLNSGISNNDLAISALSVSSSNYAYTSNVVSLSNALSNQINKEVADVLNLNNFASNISVASSNYATLTGIQTITNKTFDYNSNTFLNLPSAGGGGVGVSFISKSGLINITDSSTKSYAHGLGTIPTLIKFNGGFYNNSSGAFASCGTYTTSNNTNYSINFAGSEDNTFCISAKNFTGYVSAIDSTNFTVVWSIPGGSPSFPNYHILWTAEGGQVGAGPSNYYSSNYITSNITNTTTNTGSNNYYLNDQPIGAIIDYAGSNVTTAPQDWLFCNGSAISRTTYSMLFAIIGTVYGIGDGSTTFNLPNLIGKVTAGYGNIDSGGLAFGSNIGSVGGEENHTLTVNEIPSHNHNFLSGYLANGSSLVKHSWNNLTGGTFNSGDPATNRGSVIENTGGNRAHSNVQPTMIVNKIIKYTTTNNAVSINNYTYSGTGNIFTGQSNSNNYIPYWSSNNSTFLTNGIDLATLTTLTGTQTLTNKTITDSTNNVSAKGLFTATTTVSISGATAPSSNQVLTAISASNAIWSTPSAGGGGFELIGTVQVIANTQPKLIVTWTKVYKKLQISIVNIKHNSSSSQYLGLMFSIDSGTTWSSSLNITKNVTNSVTQKWANLDISFNDIAPLEKPLFLTASTGDDYYGNPKFITTGTVTGTINGINFNYLNDSVLFSTGTVCVYGFY